MLKVYYVESRAGQKRDFYGWLLRLQCSCRLMNQSPIHEIHEKMLVRQLVRAPQFSLLEVAEQ